MNIGEVLAHTLSHEQQLRENATSQLEAAASQNYPAYVNMLSQELANDASPCHVRQAAGLALKNALTAREHSRQEEYMQKWLSLQADVRLQVKQNVLHTLKSADLGAGQTASQVIAAIASIELPVNEWPDLIKILLENVTTGESSNVKQCSLQAIGFTCETINPEILSAQSNEILVAVMQGARKEEPSQEVRLVAIRALFNSLEFVRENFERQDERNLIMQVVCEGTQSPNVHAQAAAFECLAKIMQLYYDKMPFYMEQALFELTVQGMKQDNQQVALQAVEFWSTVCDEEIELATEAEYALDENVPAEHTCYNFAKGALTRILPVILWLLTKQEDDEDDDDWNVSMAAATCLSLLAQCVQDAIVAPTIPFVEGNIQNTDWRHREAAIMAFGSILEGPDEKILTPLVQTALPLLISMVRDPVVHVKDTAVWTLGRVCDVLVDCIDGQTQMHDLISALVAALNDSPKIVTNCCWALMNLVNQFGKEDIESAPHILTGYFEVILTALVRVSENSENDQSRTSAYETISAIISQCGKASFPMVTSLCDVMISRLEQTIAVQNQILGVDERMHHAELQSNICSCITTIVRRLNKDIVLYADRIMTALLQILHMRSKQTNVIEDVFLTIGALTTALENDFGRYLDSFVPFLYEALQNHEEYQQCQIAVGLVGDICRGLGEQSVNYCGPFMTALFEDLRSDKLHRSVKPAILSCFGDVALAIGGRYQEYMDLSLTVLHQAGLVRTTDDDYEMVEYIGSLQEGILEAYTGIVQGLNASGKGQCMGPHVQHIFEFLAHVYDGKDTPDNVLRIMIGLLGDLGETFPNGEMKSLFQEPWVRESLKIARSNRSSASTKETARWAKDIIKRTVG